MTELEVLYAELERDESVRLKPYRCPAGRLTIGVGRNLDDVGITRPEARYLLENDVARVASELDEHLAWWSMLDPVRRRVVLNMGFNLGTFGLLGFHRTLAAVQSGNYVGAAAAMLQSEWARQVGERAKRLATMMATGKAPL